MSFLRTRNMAGSVIQFMNQVYLWMFAGLALSGVTAYLTASSPEAMSAILAHSFLFYAIIILQFGAVIWLSVRVQSMSVMFAGSLFLAYSILTGLTFSVIFLVYKLASIASVFFITSGAFLGLSLVGYMTKRDLGPVGSFCMMGLFGMIGVMLIGWIFPSVMSSGLSMAINVIGVIVFSGLTAYDTQKIKMMGAGMMGNDVASRAAIHGALMLYLDFINLFLMLLNLFGDRR